MKNVVCQKIMKKSKQFKKEDKKRENEKLDNLANGEEE